MSAALPVVMFVVSFTLFIIYFCSFSNRIKRRKILAGKFYTAEPPFVYEGNNALTVRRGFWSYEDKQVSEVVSQNDWKSYSNVAILPRETGVTFSREVENILPVKTRDRIRQELTFAYSTSHRSSFSRLEGRNRQHMRDWAVNKSARQMPTSSSSGKFQ